jgi:hypothetical protein
LNPSKKVRSIPWRVNKESTILRVVRYTPQLGLLSMKTKASTRLCFRASRQSRQLEGLLFKRFTTVEKTMAFGSALGYNGKQ